MALNSASLKNSLAGYLQTIAHRTDASADTINTHGEILRKVADLVDVVATKEADIVASRNLSAEGKSQALAELGTATASRLAFVGKKVDQLATDRRDTERALFTIKPPANIGADPLLRLLYGQEIRARYLNLSQQEKDIEFLRASQAEIDDPDDEDLDAVERSRRDEVLWALQESPGGPPISKDILDRALAERARRTNPATYARLQQVKLLYDMVATLRDSLVDWLRSLGGDPKNIYSEMGGDEPATAPIDVARKIVHA